MDEKRKEKWCAGEKKTGKENGRKEEGRRQRGGLQEVKKQEGWEKKREGAEGPIDERENSDNLEKRNG